MTRATNAVARFANRFTTISENESLFNASQADAFQANVLQTTPGLLGSGLWHGNDCGSDNFKPSHVTFGNQSFGSQCSRLSMLPSAYRPIELEALSKGSRTINEKPYRSREFERTDAIPA